jgi:hypothetical protein
MPNVKEGTLVEVTFEVRVPKEASVEDVKSWLMFSLGATGSCKSSNPLINEPVEPWGNSFDWDFTEYLGRREEGPHEKTEGGGERYQVFYRRERIA